MKSTGLKPLQQLGRVVLLLCGFASQASASSGGGGTDMPSLFTDLKTFLGATNAANIQAANVLLYMLPPFYDITVAVTGRFAQGEDAKHSWQEKQLRLMAQYNIMTPTGLTTDTVLAGQRVNFCVDPNGKTPSTYCDYRVPNSGDDVLASTLMNTLGYSDQERIAALQYIQNLTVYTPVAYPGDSAVFRDPDDKSKGLKDPDGINYFAKAFKVQASLTMAQNALLAIFADRTRMSDFGAGLPVGDKKGNASMMEMLDYEISRRYQNQNWYDSMSKASDSAMLREIANMLALQNFMQFKQYTQGAQIQAMLAAQLSASNQTAVAQANQPTMNADQMIKKLNTPR